MINNSVAEDKVNGKPFVSDGASGLNGFFVSGESIPPFSNTGVLATRGLSALIDWFAFTVKIPNENIYSLLKLSPNEFVEMKRGLNGYLKHLKRGSISILFNGQVEGMGVHVFMTGEGCREYENKHGDRWKELISDVFGVGGHFTRVDGAIDDFKGYFTINDVEEKVKQRHVKSNFRKATLHVGYGLSEWEGNSGMTVYFGSKSSIIKVRMYDKAKQQGVDYFWNRIEVECREERANLLCTEMLQTDNFGQLLAGVLKSYINFIEPRGDSNRSRWDITNWWDDFLGDVDKVKLTIKKIQKTLTEVVSWVERQVAPSLALIKEHMGRSFSSFMLYMLIDGKKRWNPKHHAIYQASMG